MGDREVSILRGVLLSHKTKEPKIVPQRSEEIFSALKESVVSGVCMK
jgi:hypothetical protein